VKGKANVVREKSWVNTSGLLNVSERRVVGKRAIKNGGQYIFGKGVVKRQHFDEVRSVAVSLGLLVWFVSLKLATLVFSRLSVRVLQRHAYADDRAHFDRFAGAGSLEEDYSGLSRLIRARHHYLHV